MIVLGNREFVMGMKLCGLTNGVVVSKPEDVTEAIKNISSTELILANAYVVAMVKRLEQYDNVVTIPDTIEAFDSVDDLKSIIKAAVGMELNVEE